ncbi:DUF6165 family protein [Luteimonas terrae]|uniref:Uncharacterized protein n=1 Tax=Luteimonas terrae TaxID=1530191 RepID=A0A4R5UD70_9GAMM|nr:DUF6165 family protein [Luteimonas terrae]TDK33224.1 hypothetical protein E2F49_04090 [Luteimonas terrae]
MSTILAPVSIGELADKITILEIKSERIADPQKLQNVRTELDGLLPLWTPLAEAQPEMATLKIALREANALMWDVQDALRAKEAAQVFDDAFVTLARAVAKHNGDRVAVKNQINRLAGSRFVEEKQYR